MNKLLLKFLNVTPRKPDDIKIVMGGLRDSGKSMILTHLAFKGESATIPTPAFNKEKFKYRTRNIHLWDLSCHETRRFWFWDNLAVDSKGLIYVVDSSEAELLPESKIELDRILKLDTLKNIPLLVYANKYDKKEIEPEPLARQLGLFQIKDREWFVQPSNTLDRTGLFEGLDWLLGAIKKHEIKEGHQKVDA